MATPPSTATATTEVAAYRHADHAGNFADLFKHTLLIALLDALRATGEPLVYLESHAGAGRYTPGTPSTRRLAALASFARDASPAPFVRLLAECDTTGARPVYPGSPWLAARLLGSRDRLGLVERATAPRRALETLFADDPRVTCRPGDGFDAVLDLLPAGTRRGLLLADPPYVGSREGDAVLQLLVEARERWPSGTLAAWYPRRDDGIASRLREGVRTHDLHAAYDCWIERASPVTGDMRGCGVLVINPPRGFARDWHAVGVWLAERLFVEGAGRGGVAAPDRIKA